MKMITWAEKKDKRKEDAHERDKRGKGKTGSNKKRTVRKHRAPLQDIGRLGMRKKKTVWMGGKTDYRKNRKHCKGEKAEMKKYIVVDDTTTKRSSLDTYVFDTEQEALQEAENLLAHTTKKEKEDIDAFYVGYGDVDEEEGVDFDSIDVIKEYI